MKLSIVFTGGTIGSALQGNCIDTSDTAPLALLRLYRKKSGDDTVFRTVAPYTLLSENLTFAHLDLLRNTILTEMSVSDGIIVTHGTDTLPYTAAALSYFFGLCEKPVILVSSNYILSDMRSNGVENFSAAVAFLKEEKEAKGVYVSYRNTGESTHIHRAARVFAHLSPTDEIRSLEGVVAMHDQGKTHTVSGYSEKTDQIPPLLSSSLNQAAKRVLFLRAHPDMIYPSLSDNMGAVLFETYHSGTLATSTSALQQFTHTAYATNIPIFAAGITGETTYAGTEKFASYHIISLPRISPVAAYVKLSLLLAAGRDPIKEMPRSLGGDISPLYD